MFAITLDLLRPFLILGSSTACRGSAPQGARKAGLRKALLLKWLAYISLAGLAPSWALSFLFVLHLGVDGAIHHPLFWLHKGARQQKAGVLQGHLFVVVIVLMDL